MKENLKETRLKLSGTDMQVASKLRDYLSHLGLEIGMRSRDYPEAWRTLTLYSPGSFGYPHLTVSHVGRNDYTIAYNPSVIDFDGPLVSWLEEEMRKLNSLAGRLKRTSPIRKVKALMTELDKFLVGDF